MTNFLRDNFYASHWLDAVPEVHPAYQLHSHPYAIRIDFSSADENLWIDFGHLWETWQTLKAKIHFKTLNFHAKNATCERVAEWIAGQMQATLNIHILVDRVELEEVGFCGVVWRRET